MGSDDNVLGRLSDSDAGSPLPQGSGNPLDDVLGALGGQNGSGGLGDLLGGLLGGQAGSGGGDLLGALGGQSGAGGLGDLLGGLLGGQADSGGDDLLGALGGQGGAGGLGDVLGGLLGGQGSSPSQPSADLGGVLQVVLGKIFSGQGGDIGNLLQMAAGGQPIDSQQLQASGLTDDVMAQTGLDANTANDNLTQVIQTLGSRMSPR